MNINFYKTDRLITLIEDSALAISKGRFMRAGVLKKTQPELYNKLIEITASDLDDEEKHNDRIIAFSKAYNCEGNLILGTQYLKRTFDEYSELRNLARAYWQIQNTVIFSNIKNDYSDIQGLMDFINKHHAIEAPFADIIAEVVQNQEPKIKDIEAEFWVNCPDTEKINDFCNIYRERWNDHLKKCDNDFFSTDSLLFDEENEYCCNFKDLRACGLLRQSQAFAEIRVSDIAMQINTVCEGVISLFKKMRSSAAPSQMLLPEESKTGSLKVKAALLIELLRKAGIDKSNTDYTKIAKIISYITGKSYNNIYNETLSGIEFTKYHSKEINEVNGMLSGTCIGITLEQNKKY